MGCFQEMPCESGLFVSLSVVVRLRNYQKERKVFSVNGKQKASLHSAVLNHRYPQTKPKRIDTGGYCFLADQVEKGLRKTGH